MCQCLRNWLNHPHHRELLCALGIILLVYINAPHSDWSTQFALMAALPRWFWTSYGLVGILGMILVRESRPFWYIFVYAAIFSFYVLICWSGLQASPGRLIDWAFLLAAALALLEVLRMAVGCE